MEYLTRAPHECKYRLTETGKVFNRTVHELPEFNAYRAGLGWAAVARYAAHLLNQPWRKEYRLLRVSYIEYHSWAGNVVTPRFSIRTHMVAWSWSNSMNINISSYTAVFTSTKWRLTSWARRPYCTPWAIRRRARVGWRY